MRAMPCGTTIRADRAPDALDVANRCGCSVMRRPVDMTRSLQTAKQLCACD